MRHNNQKRESMAFYSLTLRSVFIFFFCFFFDACFLSNIQTFSWWNLMCENIKIFSISGLHIPTAKYQIYKYLISFCYFFSCDFANSNSNTCFKSWSLSFIEILDEVRLQYVTDLAYREKNGKFSSPLFMLLMFSANLNILKLEFYLQTSFIFDFRCVTFA